MGEWFTLIELSVVIASIATGTVGDAEFEVSGIAGGGR